MPQQEIPAAQLARFRELISHILPGNRFYAAKLARTVVKASQVQTTAEFRQLPFTCKSELIADQVQNPPYGTALTYELSRYTRLHQSSGTTGTALRWLDTPESWDWYVRCWLTVYDTVRVGCGDRFFFPFSFGPFIGFWGAFEAAVRRGNFALSGGGMTSPARLRFIMDNQASILACTPTYALRLAEVARDIGLDLAAGPVRVIVVAGEPGGSLSTTRDRIEQLWGARVFDHGGMTEVGAVSVECPENPGGLHVIEDEFIAEVLDQDTQLPVEPGAQGELVLTNLGRLASPLIRYRTGDLVRLDPAPCPCGRYWMRLAGGILGRLDDMVLVRGNNLYPAAVEQLLRGIPGIAEYRCLVKAHGALNSLEIQIEPATTIPEPELVKQVSQAFQDRFHFRANIQPVPPGTLPRFELKADRWRRE